MTNNDQRLTEILKRLDSISYIKLEKIPEISLYMDQVTSFMDEHLSDTKRSPEDKVLTKTMINNYAKNRLLPAPQKKKYSKEHLLLLIFIYYYKSLISISDIEQLLRPITERHFDKNADLTLSDIYKEVFSLEESQMDRLKEDVKAKFQLASETFQDAREDEREYLQLFAFISTLSFDVYLKKQIVESIIDHLREESDQDAAARKKR